MHFPKNLQILRLSYKFNHPIKKGDLPNLHTLEFSGIFNHSLDGILPKTLKELILNVTFNHPLNDIPSLDKLTLSHKYKHSLDKLQCLIIRYFY